MNTWIKIGEKIFNLDRVIAFEKLDKDIYHVHLEIVSGWITIGLNREDGQKFMKKFEKYLKSKKEVQYYED